MSVSVPDAALQRCVTFGNDEGAPQDMIAL